MSVKDYRRQDRSAGRPQLSSAALTLELLRVLAELKRRTALLDSFRDKDFDDPQFAEVMIELREPIATPMLDRAISDAVIRLPAAAAPYCMEALRRIRRLGQPRKAWERLLHDEVLLLLASVSVQRAVNRLVELED